MKLLFVTNTSWNIANYRLSLIHSLQEEGHRVHAIAPIDDFSDSLKNKVDSFSSIQLSRKGTNPFTDFYLFIQLVRLYKRIKPDVIIHYTIKPNIYGSMAANWVDIPFVNNVTGLGTVFLHNNLSSRIAKRLYKFSFKKAKTVFFQNNADKTLFIEQGLCPKPIAQLIPGSGIDTSFFKRENKISNTLFTFIYIGRMLYDKGIIELINAIKILKQEGHSFQFYFAGQIETDAYLGINQNQLEQWEKEGLITYLGLVPNIKTTIESVDCVVLPSYREGTPRALLEAGSMETPVVATDVPGCQEVVIDEKTGFLCKPKNSTSLTNALKKMILLPFEKRAEMGSFSRERIKANFSDQVISKQYIDLLKTLEQK
ncbi:MAG: glycosyltransferase family 4 protein [Cyclobacteriaceae bacterium]